MALDRADAATPAKITPPSDVLGLWQAYRAARRNVLGIVPEPAYRERIVMGGTRLRWLMLMDPPAIEYVLKTRARQYPRSDVTRRLLSPREGESLFTAEWEEWRWLHRAMTPIFRHESLIGLTPAMSQAAESASTRIAAGAGTAPLDVYPIMVGATFDVINDTALSGEPGLDRDEVARAITAFIMTSARISILDILGVPGWVPRPGRVFARGVKRMDRMVDRIIARRRAEGPRAEPDLLDRLIAARDAETGRRMTPVELRNNLLAFIVAGHETTALALTWALYLLAFDPAVQARAAEEAAFLGERAAGAEDLDRLGYIRQILEEAMRLYPPAGFLSRTAETADVVAGVPVSPGGTVMIPVYALHRNRLIWDAPDAFDPDRFAPEAKAGRHRFAYLPFGAGPRICIGMNFALIEAQIVLATLIRRFAFALPADFSPRPEMVLTLRPTGGMPLIVTPRG